MSELANLRIYWGQTAMEQSSCFRLLSVYMFATIAQSLVYFLVVLDIHKMWPDYLYTIAMCTPAMLIAIVALLASCYNMNNEEVKKYCYYLKNQRLPVPRVKVFVAISINVPRRCFTASSQIETTTTGT
ncbi:hypothetical protein ANCCEY_14296 [Ancylostoma ceylanicum]|uniref:Uncharacterized protein n=1 Tax=Ancylostoma ceylanicum TaxID=53326 RepID=A0A0D6L6V7_9BILA|nr:hypothetical protein ANCCEY_14296 [Ancylostoma ceylanicum]